MTATEPFKVIQDHRFWYQWKARIQIRIQILVSSLIVTYIIYHTVSELLRRVGEIIAIDSGCSYLTFSSGVDY